MRNKNIQFSFLVIMMLASMVACKKEEYTVKRSRRERQILAALAPTGEDALVIRDATGERLGVLSLIWGNEESGECLIADHTDNDAMEALYQAAQR